MVRTINVEKTVRTHLSEGERCSSAAAENEREPVFSPRAGVQPSC